MSSLARLGIESSDQCERNIISPECARILRSEHQHEKYNIQPYSTIRLLSRVTQGSTKNSARDSDVNAKSRTRVLPYDVGHCSSTCKCSIVQSAAEVYARIDAET